MEPPPGGAKEGLAWLMRPVRPLPTCSFVGLPLRCSPNDYCSASRRYWPGGVIKHLRPTRGSCPQVC